MAFSPLVLHIDMDSFFVSVEQRRDARLKNRPLLIGGHSARSVVASCSYEARALGIRSGMPLSTARRLCPEALILRGDMDLYTRTSQEITELLQQRLPCLEKASIDEFYADLSGMERFFGGVQYAQELRQSMIQELGLPVSFGMSINKTVSKIATGQAKPSGSKTVPQGQEIPFLSPLPVRSIPMAGPVITSKLENMGIVQIERLQQIPLHWMGQAFGKQGIELGQKARGIDPMPVTPYREQKSMSAEITFDQDLADPSELRRHLVGMAERWGKTSGTKRRAAKMVKIRYSDFQTHTATKNRLYLCRPSTHSNCRRAAQALVCSAQPSTAYRTPASSGWVSAPPLLSLFDNPAPQQKLYQAMDESAQPLWKSCHTSSQFARPKNAKKRPTLKKTGLKPRFLDFLLGPSQAKPLPIRTKPEPPNTSKPPIAPHAPKANNPRQRPKRYLTHRKIRSAKPNADCFPPQEPHLTVRPKNRPSRCSIRFPNLARPSESKANSPIEWQSAPSLRCRTPKTPKPHSLNSSYHQCASSQLLPIPTCTSKGTDSGYAAGMCVLANSTTRSSSETWASNTNSSCTCNTNRLLSCSCCMAC